MSTMASSASDPDEWSPFPPARRREYRPRPFEIPGYFYPGGQFALDGIALRAGALGFVLSASLNLSWHMRNSYFQLPLFLSLLSVFHFMEYWITARFNTRKAKVSAYLLASNGAAYNIAHGAAFVEGLVEWFFFPGMKAHLLPTTLGLVLIAVGQVARSLAMAHAGTNFSHLVMVTQEEGHVLVKTGIYAYVRHPSYFGFFWWGLGTQLVLGNPICLLGYTCVLWRFFSARIRGEERLLVDFFGDEYLEYRAATPTLIPLIG